MGLFSSLLRGTVKASGRSIRRSAKRAAVCAGTAIAVNAIREHRRRPPRVSTNVKTYSNRKNVEITDYGIDETEDIPEEIEIEIEPSPVISSQYGISHHSPNKTISTSKSQSLPNRIKTQKGGSSSRSYSRSSSRSSSRRINGGGTYGYSKSYTSGHSSRSSSSNVSIESLKRKMKK